MNNKIKYEIPVSGKVTIKIVDNIGMPAGVILNKHSEAGSYEVSLDEQMLMPGNYYYKIFFSDLNHSNTTLPNKNGSSKGTPYSSLIPGEAIATGEVKIKS